MKTEQLERSSTPRFEYGFVSQRPGLLSFIFLLLISAGLAVFSGSRGRPLQSAEYGVLMGICFVMFLMGLAMDRVARRLHGVVMVSDLGITWNRSTFATVELRWDAVQAILPFRKWSAWGRAGGGHSGLRIVSTTDEIVIYRNIRGWSELRILIEQKAVSVGIPFL